MLKNKFYNRAYVPKRSARKLKIAKSKSAMSEYSSNQSQPAELDDQMIYWRSGEPDSFRDRFNTPNDYNNRIKAKFGYVKDSAYTIASDPNTLINKNDSKALQTYYLFHGRNSRFSNYADQDPQTLAPKDGINNTFYSFGNRETNLRDALPYGGTESVFDEVKLN